MSLMNTTGSLMLIILVLTLSYKTNSAPTHHLTVGVQGNTPTLIVTSSEIGLTPKAKYTNEKLTKQQFKAKTIKDLNLPKKLIKVKLNKTQIFFNKKDKLQFPAKPLAQQTFREENLLQNKKSFETLKPFTNTLTKLKAFSKTTTATLTDATTITNLPLSTQAAKQKNVSPSTTQPEEISTTDTYSSNDANNLHTVKPWGLQDSTTTDATDIDVTTETQTETKINSQDNVLQTQETTQVFTDASFREQAENENVNTDEPKPESTLTTENILLTTVATKSTTAAEISTPTLDTLATDIAETTTTSALSSLSLTKVTSTTEHIVNDDKSKTNGSEQQTATEIVENRLYGPALKHFNKKEQIKTTENPLTQNEQSELNETSNEFPHNIIKIESTTEAQVKQQPPVLLRPKEKKFKQLKTERNKQEPTAASAFKQITEFYEPTTTTTTTEGVLKLIDLEKHVVKTIHDLRQPSLLLTGQRDNGHDGLKNIKKKQLVDKHYVEALLHKKQDGHTKQLPAYEKDNLPQTTPNPATAVTVILSPEHLTAANHNKSFLIPQKNGYLGPILMEEKTFHVIHHANNNDTINRDLHVNNIESQLRRGHFVELKAKIEGPINEENYSTKEVQMLTQTKDQISTNTQKLELLEMQADQSAKNVNSQNVEMLVENKKAKQLKLHNLERLRSTTAPNKKLEVLLVIKPSAKKFNVGHNNSSTKSLKVLPTSKPKQAIESREKNSISQSNSSFTLPSKNYTERPDILQNTQKKLVKTVAENLEKPEQLQKHATVLSTTVFQVIDSLATKTPIVQADTLFTTEDKQDLPAVNEAKGKTESKISDIQIEVYDSTIDSIVASTNFKDVEYKQQPIAEPKVSENYLGKTTKPPVGTLQQERFTQYIIDRTESSTLEPINYSTIQVASGKPEPAAIEIHINVSESFGNESEDSEFSYPQTDYNNKYNNRDRAGDVNYDENKVNDNIKLKIPTTFNGNGKELRNDEILVVEIIDTDNNTDPEKPKSTDELFIKDAKDVYTTPPLLPPPPPPYQTNFDRDSDTIFYISNTEVKVGESLPVTTKNTNEERKLRLESQFFPVNYMASTHASLSNTDDLSPNHHLYEEDIIVSSNSNQADSLKIYRNNNEPAPPLDVTYVGESIIEVEQSPESVVTTTYAPDQQHNVVVTPQADIIIQPAILPEISIGVPVIGELPPQIELKEIDFMPNEAQVHRSGIYDDNDNSNSNNNNNIFSNDIDENVINVSSNNHEADIVGNNNQHVDESSIQYGGDLIDESADGGFDGVEGSYPFGNPAALSKFSSSSYSANLLSRLRKQQQQQQPNHVADYAHSYINYGVNNMRKDELSADIKDSGEMLLVGGSSSSPSNNNVNIASNDEQNASPFKEFLNKVSMSNSTIPFLSANFTQTERMSNATAFSVAEDANDLEDKSTEDIINLISLAIGLFIVILPVVVTCSMFWALRYLYKKYHSSLTENGGYTEQTDTKVPLNEEGVEKGEFFHETCSSPTNSLKDTIENYPVTSNKPSTTDNNIEFSSVKFISHLETSTSNTNTSYKANSFNAITCKRNESVRLSLPLSYPIAQQQTKSPTPSASSPITVLATTKAQIQTVHGDVDDAIGIDDAVEMPGPNGSITKMTLENNLLIVETEERNDISRVARETKMDYNKDGVFVVEVARGIDSKTIPESPVTEGNEKMFSMFDVKQNNGGVGYKMLNEKNYVNNEKVQIHSPPPDNQEEGPRSLHQIEEVEEPINSPPLMNDNEHNVILNYKANTGLSQSDLSSTSSSDSNKDYCYGNQELYVVEQKGYSTTTPTATVVLKCDVKDINDDDRNPENDHYLKNSPNKREESTKDKKDIMETAEKTEEGQARTSSGESPNQKANDEFKKENDLVYLKSCEEKESVKVILDELESDSKLNDSVLNETSDEFSEQPQNFSIPVEIEVHVTPAEIENSTKEENLLATELTASISEETPSLILENKRESENDNSKDENPPLILENQPEIENDSAKNKTLPFILENQPEIENDSSEEITAKEEQEDTRNNETHESFALLKPIEEKEYDENLKTNGVEFEDSVSLNNVIKENESSDTKKVIEDQVTTADNLELNGILKNKEKQENSSVTENYPEPEPDALTQLQANGNLDTENIELSKKQLRNAFNNNEKEQKLQSDIVTEDTNTLTLPDLSGEINCQQVVNGHAEVAQINNSLNELENGYDSIMSLPEPPPTTDEQLTSDLSDQQLDSLPPPPPPEIFNLKDLPPPLTNGNPDFPRSEESTNFFNSLPPPPPNGTEVTVTASAGTTNGKVHISPLTPPASPPAHFTNNLHAGLCSQPIAVDVNGS